MRILARLAMIAMTGAAAGAAQAQSLAKASAGAAFAGSTASNPSFPGLAERPVFDALGRPVQFNSSRVRLSSRDELRVTTGSSLNAPGGLPLNLDRAYVSDQSYEVSVIRNWPRAMSFETDKFDIGLSPYAGVGVSNRGKSAEAGAEVRLQSRDDKAAAKLRAMGVKDGASFGDRGRWYLFAAAGARAVGLNMLRGEAGGWDRAGWTTDPAAALIGDAQVGVGYRKGAMQTSFGVIHREVKGEHKVFGQQTDDDSIVALSFSIKPGAR